MKSVSEKMITLREGGKVYTKTIGQGIPILLLHGGPGSDHICFKIFEEYIDLNKFSLVYYDQLGSTRSDKITDLKLLSIPRFVDEVEQVREALKLEKFILLGHSWGGILCMEYAVKYGCAGHLLGIVVSNMVDSIAIHLEYLEKLRKELLTKEEYSFIQEIEQRGEENDPRYQKIIDEKLNRVCLCRLETLPEVFRDSKGPNETVYHYFQGNNDFVVTGALLGWNITDRISKIRVKALFVGAKYDTMPPERIEYMSKIVSQGQYFICPNGSHLCYWDDSNEYFCALNQFISEL